MKSAKDNLLDCLHTVLKPNEPLFFQVTYRQNSSTQQYRIFTVDWHRKELINLTYIIGTLLDRKIKQKDGVQYFTARHAMHDISKRISEMLFNDHAKLQAREI